MPCSCPAMVPCALLTNQLSILTKTVFGVPCHVMPVCCRARDPGPSIEEAEAEMRPAAVPGDPARFLPKSMRQQLQDAAAAEAAEKKLQEEVVVSWPRA